MRSASRSGPENGLLRPPAAPRARARTKPRGDRRTVPCASVCSTLSGLPRPFDRVCEFLAKKDQMVLAIL